KYSAHVRRVERPAPRDARGAVGLMAGTARRPRRDTGIDPPRGPKRERKHPAIGFRRGIVHSERVLAIRFEECAVRGLPKPPAPTALGTRLLHAERGRLHLDQLMGLDRTERAHAAIYRV